MEGANGDGQDTCALVCAAAGRGCSAAAHLLPTTSVRATPCRRAFSATATFWMNATGEIVSVAPLAVVRVTCSNCATPVGAAASPAMAMTGGSIGLKKTFAVNCGALSDERWNKDAPPKIWASKPDAAQSSRTPAASRTDEQCGGGARR